METVFLLVMKVLALSKCMMCLKLFTTVIL